MVFSQLITQSELKLYVAIQNNYRVKVHFTRWILFIVFNKNHKEKTDILFKTTGVTNETFYHVFVYLKKVLKFKTL